MSRAPHTPTAPHTPHTPGGGGNGSSLQTPARGQLADDIRLNNNDTLAQLDLSSDLNFDPAAVIEGGGEGQEGLNLLPDSVVDPMDLLSYLDPPELDTPPSSGGSSVGAGSSIGHLNTGNLCTNSTNDDLLALFD